MSKTLKEQESCDNGAKFLFLVMIFKMFSYYTIFPSPHVSL